MKETSASNRASEEDAIDSKWLKCLCHHAYYAYGSNMLIMLLYLASDLSNQTGRRLVEKKEELPGFL